MAKPNDTIRISPSLLASDFCRLAEDIACMEAGGADMLHLDIMDGHFVPNLSFGVPVVKSIASCTDLLLDTHLMITDPGKYAEPFAKAGSGLITFHIEVTDEPANLVKHIRDLGVKVGVSLNPGTPADAIDSIIEDVDLVLVMTVWPGFGGQSFIEDCVPKVEQIAAKLRPEQWLEVDGGIDRKTVSIVSRAGANTMVAGSAIFRADDPAAEVAELRQRALHARSGKLEPKA